MIAALLFLLAPIAVTDMCCVPHQIQLSGPKSQVVACFAQLDKRPPPGAVCTWEWGAYRAATSAECKGDLAQAKQTYRTRDLGGHPAVAVRFAVFAKEGDLLVDRTFVIEVIE